MPAARIVESGKSRYVRGTAHSGDPPSTISPSHRFRSAMKPSQLAPSASTPKGNVPATSPVSTSSCAIRPKLSAEKPNGRRSSRTKRQNFPHHPNPHRQTSPSQPRGQLSTRDETLPARLPNATHRTSPSRGCSTISPSSKPSVPSSSTLSSSPATRTASRAISNTCCRSTRTRVPSRRCRWRRRRWR